MSIAIRGMLFGGAIFCAGLAGADARGEVVNELFRFTGDVSDEYQWDGTYVYGSPNYVSVGNNSFDVSGGLGIAPFSQSAMGGAQFGFPYPREDVTVSGVATETAGGGLDTRLAASASVNPAYDFPYGPTAVAELAFTLTASMSFELELYSFAYDNDTGSGSLVLQEVGGGLIYSISPFDSAGVVASGTLDAGDYRFRVYTSGNASGDAELRIFPAPGPALTIGVAGLFAVRRRRC